MNSIIPHFSVKKKNNFLSWYTDHHNVIILTHTIYFTRLGVCPVLCSQHGEYINGECQCNPGWKGKECSLRHDECEVPDCNGHGHCVSGKCQCVRGYKGKFCEEGKFSSSFLPNKFIQISGSFPYCDFFFSLSLFISLFL